MTVLYQEAWQGLSPPSRGAVFGLCEAWNWPARSTHCGQESCSRIHLAPFVQFSWKPFRVQLPRPRRVQRCIRSVAPVDSILGWSWSLSYARAHSPSLSSAFCHQRLIAMQPRSWDELALSNFYQIFEAQLSFRVLWITNLFALH